MFADEEGHRKAFLELERTIGFHYRTNLRKQNENEAGRRQLLQICQPLTRCMFFLVSRTYLSIRQLLCVAKAYAPMTKTMTGNNAKLSS